MISSAVVTTSLLLLISSSVSAFNIFEQMFGGQQQAAPQNAPSDAQQYRQNYESLRCTNYVCPGTLACVHFPHHCPCAFSDIEDKVELGEGIAICASKGGFRQDETLKKVELARKGFL